MKMTMGGAVFESDTPKEFIDLMKALGGNLPQEETIKRKPKVFNGKYRWPQAELEFLINHMEESNTILAKKLKKMGSRHTVQAIATAKWKLNKNK